jgi:hypothetical protein
MHDFDHQMLSQNTFGLADALWLEDLPEGIVTAAVAAQDLAASAHLMPRLIDLRKLPDAQTDALLESMYRAHKIGHQPSMPLLAKTDVDAAQFARQWNAMQLATPEPGRKVWLRLHDPRVLHQLLRVATPVQRRKLFGRCEAFTYWVGGEWVTARAEVTPSSSFSGAPKWDWPRIERIGIVNRALDSAGVRHAAALTRQGASAEQLIERALTRHRIADHEDMVEFVVRGLTTSATFDEHPLLAGLIKPRTDPDDESTLAHRLAAIDESIWNELRQPATL